MADVLEQRWNAKLEQQQRVERELQSLSETTAALGPADEAAIRALGEDFATVWGDAACAMTLNKRIARILIKEIVVDLDDDAQELSLVIHWHGGCHTAFTMPKPLSGALAHKTALEDVELITAMARRYADGEIARVLSKLGRRTGKGNRWTQSRVATVRGKYGIAAPDAAELDPDVLTLAQATRYTGVSDTTLMRLIKASILAAEQIAPYAPLEIRRSDLDSDPISGIVKHLKATGKLALDGDKSAEQTSLFQVNQTLAQRGYYDCFSRLNPVQYTLKTLRYNPFAKSAYISTQNRKPIVNLAVAMGPRAWMQGLWNPATIFNLPA